MKHMKHRYALAAMFLLSMCCAHAQDPLPRARPEAVGLAPEKLGCPAPSWQSPARAASLITRRSATSNKESGTLMPATRSSRSLP
jgi:hypothetical protein